MITESIIAVIGHSIVGDDIIINEDLLVEALFKEMPSEEWEGSEVDMRELTTTQWKMPTKLDPSIDKSKTLLLPTFVPDYDLNAITRGIWNLLQRAGSIVVLGTPGFSYQNETAPYINQKTGSADIDRAIEQGRVNSTLIITGIDDHSLSDIQSMDLAGPETTKGRTDDWLRNLTDTLRDLEERDIIDVEKYPAIPRKFGAYIGITPNIYSNAVMLFSKKYGEGFYIVSKRIDDMDWDVAIQAFYQDPESYLEKVGIDPSQMGKARRGRVRLLFRDYVRATNQGAYVNRAGRMDDIVDFANGETIEGIPAGIFEHLLYPTYFI